MPSRASYQKAAPEVFQGMLALTSVVQKSGLAPGLLDLVNQRVSQINGCAYCLDMLGLLLCGRRRVQSTTRNSAERSARFSMRASP